MDIERKIKKALKEGNAVIGTRSVINSIKNGNISTVIHANNTPHNTLNDLKYYASINSGIKIETFEGNSSQLGEMCGKPFGILLLGIGNNDK